MQVGIRGNQVKIYLVKINDEAIVEQIVQGNEFVHDGISNFEKEIQVGDPVFIYFGGDKSKISWKQGIKGVGKVTASPFDKGYDSSRSNNFKIKIMPVNLLDNSIPPRDTKIHPRLASSVYEIPYVGANHFPNQAIASYRDEIGIKALMEIYNEYGQYDFRGFPDLPPSVTPATSADLSEFLLIATSLQAKPFLILTGLSGSGKTLQALRFAKWITPKTSSQDVFVSGAQIQSTNVTYYVGKSDNLSVEFWNSDEPESTTKVTLPREMISEWADYIESESISYSTPAREIREAVKTRSKFSDQLHSFETHLKAAAFAMIRNSSSSNALRNYEIISVGADWTSNENLLGYPDALHREPNNERYCKPDNGALDLLLRAHKNPNEPYFLILDEMNLSHVERYFSDFLSAMESGEKINLHDDTGKDWSEVPAKLGIPKNLFVIGTVNIDETTYMFSPKVLDRANVIEFRVSDEEMRTFLADPSKPELDSVAGQGEGHAKAFLENATKRDISLEAPVRIAVQETLMDFFPALKEAGAEFGYRTAHEIFRFIYFYQQQSGEFDQEHTITDPNFIAAMDAAIIQKLLPKLHGSKKKLGPVLVILMRLCLKPNARPSTSSEPIGEDLITFDNALFWRSLEKLGRMQQRLREYGFTSFAEA